MKTHQEQCTRRVAKRSGKRTNGRTVADIPLEGEFFVNVFICYPVHPFFEYELKVLVCSRTHFLYSIVTCEVESLMMFA